MEYMECNLYQLMKDRVRPFPESEVRNWCFHIFQALAYMHQRGYFHRDLKPGLFLCVVVIQLRCLYSLSEASPFGDIFFDIKLLPKHYTGLDNMAICGMV